MRAKQAVALQFAAVKLSNLNLVGVNFGTPSTLSEFGTREEKSGKVPEILASLGCCGAAATKAAQQEATTSRTAAAAAHGLLPPIDVELVLCSGGYTLRVDQTRYQLLSRDPLTGANRARAMPPPYV